MPDDGFGAITVLVVDDEEFSRKFAERIPGRIGVGRVLLAEGGAEALGQLAETTGRVDLVISDVEMAGMTGCEFVRRLRECAAPEFIDVPVLILPGQSTGANIPKALADKISGYLTKPPTVDVLEAQIRDVLGL